MSNNLFVGVAYFLLGDKDDGIACAEVNVDFEYEHEISETILVQMRQRKLDLSFIPDELKKSSDTKLNRNEHQTNPMKRRELTWEEISQIASKYGFKMNDRVDFYMIDGNNMTSEFITDWFTREHFVTFYIDRFEIITRVGS